MKQTSGLLNIAKIYWDDVREIFKTFNFPLFKVIEQLCPNNKLCFYRASYPYGSQILRNGKFYLPGKEKKLIPLDHPQVENEIKINLGYNLPTIPVLFVTKKSLELFVTLEDRIIPYFLINPGNVYGVWKVLDKRSNQNTTYIPYNIWDMTSGSRSLFMLPKIAEKGGHIRLQKNFNFTLDKPEKLRDHWKVFTAIAANNNQSPIWETEVLFFSKDWFENLDDPAWRDFTLYLLDFNWKCTEYWRGQYSWNLTFSRIHSSRNITPNPYHTDNVKHLMAIAVGALPGFAPAINDDLAPISFLQQAYLQIYRLNEWSPTIMQPEMYNMRNSVRPVYYSLQYPTAIELSPSSNKRASLIEDTYMISALLEKYLQDIASCNYQVEATTLKEVTELVKYDFFHNEVTDYSKLKENKIIPISDPSFTTLAGSSNYNFPHNSTFFKGCIKIFKNT